jgi:hypothetical protein
MVAPLRGGKRFITKEDWHAVRDFVRSTKREPTVGHLLSIAEKLSSEGHRRTALIEAVSALEVALHEFGRKAEERETSSVQRREYWLLESQETHRTSWSERFG